MIWSYFAAVAAFICGTILFFLWKPWGTHESVDCDPDDSDVDLADITALVPARNEAAVIGETLAGLRAQRLSSSNSPGR